MKKPLLYSGKCFLVTGGAGFIGSHLCKRLLEAKASVVCFDNLSSGRMDNIDDCLVNPSFTFIKGNCNNKVEISKVFKSHKINYVYHYAATVGVKRTQEKPELVLDDINGIKNILELSRKYAVQKFVYASSSEVYGEQITDELHEDSDPKVKMPYAVVKIVGETFCKTYWQQHGLDTTALRFFNVYGPRQDGSGYGFVVSIFVRQAIEGKDLTVFNGGQMTRSFIYIDDNIEASLRVIDNKQSSGECINVGSGNFIKIIDLARKVIDISGNNHLRARLVKSNRDGEIKNRRPSLKKMHKILKYRSAYDLDSGLLNTYNHFSKVVPTDSCASVKAR